MDHNRNNELLSNQSVEEICEALNNVLQIQVSYMASSTISLECNWYVIWGLT